MGFIKKKGRRMHFTIQEAAGALLVATLFFAALFVSLYYGEQIENLVVLGGPFGMILYLLLAVISVTLAPMAVIPFLPIAVTLWGSLATALLSTIGWTLGAALAYVLAKKYGRPFVAKFISLKRAERVAARITGKHTFWTVLISRVILPTDIVSYAIGLFVPIRLLPYTLATLIGTAPIAFALSYGVALPVKLQTVILSALAFAVLVFAIITLIHRRKTKNPLQRR